MKKIAAVTLLFLGVVLGSLGFTGTANAGDQCDYTNQTQRVASDDKSCSPDSSPGTESPEPSPSESVVYPPTTEPSPSNDVVSPPTGTVDSDDVSSGDVADETAALPNTGGPDGLLLGGALALLLAGGTAVLVARRRQTD